MSTAYQGATEQVRQVAHHRTDAATISESTATCLPRHGQGERPAAARAHRRRRGLAALLADMHEPQAGAQA